MIARKTTKKGAEGTPRRRVQSTASLSRRTLRGDFPCI
jgi:hypothetical protein